MQPVLVTRDAILGNIDLPYQLAEDGDFGQSLILELGDGNMRMSKAVACVQLTYWYPLVKWGVMPCRGDVETSLVVSDKVLSQIMTHVYNRLLAALPEVPHMQLVETMFQMQDRLMVFYTRYTGDYVQTIDILSLMRLVKHPSVQQITSAPPPEGASLTDIESHYQSHAKALTDLVTTPGALPNNPFSAMATAGLIKTDSLGQLLYAYGTRSDPLGRIVKHHISRGAIQGWANVYDMAAESLSTRQSHVVTVDIIPDSQYLFRQVRGVGQVVHKLHPGDCGNRLGVPVLIPPQAAKAFYHSAVYDGTETVYLTRENIGPYLGKRVMLVGPYGCKHRDGCCEHCYTWGWFRGTKYRIPGYALGTESASKVIGSNTQIALKVKHNVGTDGMEFVLSDSAKAYFMVGNNILHLVKPHHRDLRDLYIKIPLKSLSALPNLKFEITEPAAFSSLSDIWIGTDPDNEDYVDITSRDESPFLSLEFINFMRRHRRRLLIDQDFMTVPLKGWQIDQPLCAYTVISADVSAFIRRVKQFFESKLKQYTSVTEALNDLIALLVIKSNAPLSAVQVVLRSFLLSPDPTDPRLPIVTDVDNVKFGDVEMVTRQRSSTLLLAFEDQTRALNDPTHYLYRKQPLPGDPMFGLV